ncbi:uncharacterized protein LOC116806411 [Drosophila grimshawi]|uniref:uncharacterized protein LOC116806411 n=1 Tax=Drosophila grimshawi TaxID=7222 RepID=UPI001C9346D2|nr:uncharacterized protein LOC116806411 [Drosophila grimshawi]
MICSIQKCTVNKEMKRNQRRAAPNTHPNCRIENYGLARKNSLLAIGGRIIHREYQNVERMQSIINRRKTKGGHESSSEKVSSECLVEQEVESSCKRVINAENNNKFNAKKNLQLKNLLSDVHVEMIGSWELKEMIESHRKTPTRRADKVTKINERVRTSMNREKKTSKQAVHASNRPKKEINNNKKLLSTVMKQPISPTKVNENIMETHHNKEFVVEQQKLSKPSMQTETEAGDKIILEAKSQSMFVSEHRPEAKVEILRKTNVKIEQIKKITTTNMRLSKRIEFRKFNTMQRNKFQVNNNKMTKKNPITSKNQMASKRHNNYPEVKEIEELKKNMNEISKLTREEEMKCLTLAQKVDRKTVKPMENIVEDTKNKTKAIVQPFSLAKINVAQVNQIRQSKRLKQFCRIYINLAIQQQLMALRTTNNPFEKDQNTNIMRIEYLSRKTGQIFSKPKLCVPIDPHNKVHQKDIFYFILIFIFIALCGIGEADPYFWRWVFRRLNSFCHKYLFL